jgi:hypothetical protein
LQIVRPDKGRGKVSELSVISDQKALLLLTLPNFQCKLRGVPRLSWNEVKDSAIPL